MKMYVLVRDDLSPGAQLAQAVHAGVQLCSQTTVPETVVVLSVADEVTLLKWADRLCRGNEPWTLFHEPYWNEHTALAVVCDGSMFSGLTLAGAAMR